MVWAVIISLFALAAIAGNVLVFNMVGLWGWLLFIASAMLVGSALALFQGRP